MALPLSPFSLDLERLFHIGLGWFKKVLAPHESL